MALKLDNNLHYVKDKQDRVLYRRNHYRLKKTKEHTVRLPVVPEAVVLHSLSQQLTCTVAGKQRAHMGSQRVHRPTSFLNEFVTK